jgi:hypothetical protein
MLENTVLPGLVSVGAGILMILVRFRRWKWFMEHYKFQRTEDALGVKGADIFYLLNGLVFIVLGVLLILGVL